MTKTKSTLFYTQPVRLVLKITIPEKQHQRNRSCVNQSIRMKKYATNVALCDYLRESKFTCCFHGNIFLNFISSSVYVCVRDTRRKFTIY